jgi:hypothetical protein
MEYGDDDDDDLDDSNEESLPSTTQTTGVQKPFWALWYTAWMSDTSDVNK